MPVASCIAENVKERVLPHFVRRNLKSIAEPPSKVVLRHADRILDSLMLIVARKLARRGEQLKSAILAGKRIVDESCEWPEMLSFCAPPTLKEMHAEKEEERKKMRKPWEAHQSILESEMTYAWDYPLSQKEINYRDYKLVIYSFQSDETELNDLNLQLRRRAEPSSFVTKMWAPRILHRVMERTTQDSILKKQRAQHRLQNGPRVRAPRRLGQSAHQSRN